MSEYKVSSDPCFLVFTLAPYVYYMETSHFICNGMKYGQILTRKKNQIWTLFMQWIIFLYLVGVTIKIE